MVVHITGRKIVPRLENTGNLQKMLMINILLEVVVGSPFQGKHFRPDLASPVFIVAIDALVHEATTLPLITVIMILCLKHGSFSVKLQSINQSTVLCYEIERHI